jgi:hypothetical protein
MKSPKDPVDHARTTRPHAGESMTDTKNMPALNVIGLSLVSFVGALAAFATNHHDTGLMFASLAAAGFVICMVWLAVEHRRCATSRSVGIASIPRRIDSRRAARAVQEDPSRFPGWDLLLWS